MSLNLSTSDIFEYHGKMGVDIYPPINIGEEMTRLNVFGEDARARFPQIFESLKSGPTEFMISRKFSAPNSAGSVEVPTFVLTQRGPVINFPLVLPPPFGATGLEDSFVSLANDVRTLFIHHFSPRRIVRIGLVRDLVFLTEQENPVKLLSRKTAFAGGELVGGNLLLVFKDDKCNLRVTLDTAQIERNVHLPIGQTITESSGFGLKVTFDVNNSEVRELESGDIDSILERAESLWPDALLEFLNS